MRLGLIGLGAIGTGVLEGLAETPPAHLAVLLRPGRSAHARLPDGASAVTDAQGLIATRPDMVVECAGHEAARAHVPALLAAGVDVVLVSVGALADAALERRLRAAASEGGARLILPAGAVGGIDLLAALAPAGGLRVRYRGIKPPAAWAGTPAEAQIDLAALREARSFFEGTARQAARDYPKNANVAATLALAGAGFEETRVTLVADPAATGNRHEYTVDAPLGHFEMRIENRPTPGNPRTSAATVMSVLREIRNRQGPVAI